MKAVLGLLLILVGFTVGWLVITGKLPPATTSQTTVAGVTPPQASPSQQKGKPPLQQLGQQGSVGKA